MSWDPGPVFMTLRYARTLSDCVSVRTPILDRKDAAASPILSLTEAPFHEGPGDR